MIDLSVPSLDELHRRRGAKWSLYDDDVLCATVAEMDFPIAPPVTAALRSALARSDLGYAPAAPRSTFEALAAFAARRLDWEIDVSQVMLVPDVMVGIVELCRALAAPGERIAFAAPAYPPFFAELAGAGWEVVTVALHADGAIDLDALRSLLATGLAVLVISNPHNPTGRVLPRDELAAIAELCAANGTRVLADEIHGPLVLPGARLAPWLSVSDAAREIGVALTSASKAFNLAALKTAFVVTASTAGRELVARLNPQSDHAGLLGTIAAEAAFRDGDEWLDAVIDRLDRNRTLLGETLSERLPEVRWTPPQATYLAWLDCTALSLGDDPAAAMLTRGRVALEHGPDFGAPGAGHVRLNFATSPDHLVEAVRRMAATVDR